MSLPLIGPYMGPNNLCCVTRHFLLALLDSVSRAHGMGLLSVVRPSVGRPCRNYL